MGWLAFLILGLIAGVIARIVIPGKQPGGFWLTLLLGVLGAFLGGWLGSVIFGVDASAEFWSWESWLFSVLGAIIVILIVQAIFGRRKTA
ncbi:GlsB/YeaQ/YmgE family stress response membrane protein [Promicromonospora sp. NPDC023987]|uniref:GlsB/YeaQ/YmgE family stress response membrane protein n=1 Tax=Promicromonospora sp. NPDC023987 TaxID=3155360 RepID=UPI0033C40D90